MNKYQIDYLQRNDFHVYYLDNQLIAPQEALDLVASYDYMPSARADYMRKVQGYYDTYTDGGIGHSVREESVRQSKLTAATNFLANTATSAQTQLIQAGADISNITATQYAQSIVDQSEYIYSNIAYAETYRNNALVAIDAATTIQELESAIYPFYELLYGG